MAALILALGSWILLSIVATPFIGRFMVMRDNLDEDAPVRQPPRPETGQMVPVPVTAGGHSSLGRSNGIRSAAR